MTSQARIQALAADLRQRFEAAGALPVQTPILQPAGTLLDLYGEDIRARAYVTSDALRGEQMLRPDFTVPVVQMHMERGAEPARYTYSGTVFRRQEEDPDRANEYLQVGFELFDRQNAAAADAEVFVQISAALGDLPYRAAIGDIGLLTAAVEGLKTTSANKAALMRHIWRPRRFRALLERFAKRAPMPPGRAALLASDAPFDPTAPAQGLRSAQEIAARIALLQIEAETAPISEGEMALIDALLNVRETAPFALERLRDIAVDLPALSPVLARMETRLEAIAARGVAVETLEFEASYGRTLMEYYDGFVFGLYAKGRPDLPALATGGRYDALTRKLGAGAGIPAVGGVLRPGLMVTVQEAA